VLLSCCGKCFLAEGMILTCGSRCYNQGNTHNSGTQSERIARVKQSGTEHMVGKEGAGNAEAQHIVGAEVCVDNKHADYCHQNNKDACLPIAKNPGGESPSGI